MTNIIQIITHPGAAHRDEFMACAVILAQEWGGTNAADVAPTAVIERREPTEAELNDPSIYVVDVGGRHEPVLSNFDHHQLDRDAAPECAFTMVLEHYALYDTAVKIRGWVEFAAWLDAKGPYATAEHYGMSIDAFMSTISPVEQFVLAQFESKSVLAAGTPMVAMLHSLGRDFVVGLRKFEERMAFLREHAWVQEIDDGVSAIMVLQDALPDPALGTNVFREELQSTGVHVAVSVTPDDRGDGYMLYRYADDPRIDFSRLDGRDDILFAHAGGFIAKTKAKGNLAEVTELLQAALV